MQFVLQWRNEIARQVARKIALCNSAFTLPKFWKYWGKKEQNLKPFKFSFFNSSQGRPSNISATLMKALEEYACEISKIIIIIINSPQIRQ